MLNKKWLKFQNKKGKYKNKETKASGRSFSSKGEAGCFQMLELMERAGQIEILQAQDHVYLTDARILYIADFKIFDKEIGQTVWIEYKGFETDVWRIKRRLWIHYGPGQLRVYKGYGDRLRITETIVPVRQMELISGGK